MLGSANPGGMGYTGRLMRVPEHGRSRAWRAAAAVLAVCLGGGASAWAASEFEDIAVIYEALNQVLESQPTGVAVPWRNPETGNSGTITAVETEIRADGTPCRTYWRTYDGGAEARLVTGKACRTGNGVWNVVEESEVELAPPWREPEPEPQWIEPDPEPLVAEARPAAETQRLLADAGYYHGPVDGAMSAALRSAILDYQSARDPAFDGVAVAERLATD